MQRGQAVSPAIEIARAAIVRGGSVVLRDFDLGVEAGELVWVRGANGSGKSTLFRALGGLLPIASGKLNITGAVALCDDNLALDLDQSLENAIKFWTRLDGISPARLEAALEALDLVLLDEPYNGLDQANVTRLDAALAKHTERGGIALVASHIAPTVNVSRSILIDRTKLPEAA
jgi:heme exporter protein A